LSDTPAYERDPRLTRLETAIIGSGQEDGRSFAVLVDTVLYPEGGGQPADHGAIDGIEVADVQKVDGEIRHYMEGSPPGLSGAVTVELDWPRRFDHMQQHTGQHLLTAIADTRFGWATTAFHLGEAVSDIEVDTPNIDPRRLAELEEAVAAEIRAARPVTARRVSPEEYASMPVRSRGLPAGHTGSVRLVEIEGIDLNTCGGTHCSSTAELEALKLLGTESVRGGTRIFYVAGARLRGLLGAHHRRNAELRSLLGASDDELPGAVGARLDQLKEGQKALRALEDDLATASAEGLAGRPDGVLTAHWPDRTLPFLQKVARELDRLAPDRVAFLTCGQEEEGAFVVSAGEASEVDVRDIGGRIADILGGRGGGSGRLFQGKASALSRREEAAALLG
jgi:alanyl-tRNA synthetase